MKILLPRISIEIDPNEPFFFLAGPVLGGGDWQHQCCLEIQKYFPESTIAVPCPYGSQHPLASYFVSGGDVVFDDQLSWERHYLEWAAHSTNGCLLFWLPCESKEYPRVDGNPYAMTTYGELGEWRGSWKHNHLLNIVIGGEAGFPGLDDIVANYRAAVDFRFKEFKNMDALVLAAIRKARGTTNPVE